MANYLFIANGNKPTKDEYYSMNKVSLNNFSIPPIEAALSHGCTVFMGINRKYAHKLECDYPVKFYDANIFRNIFDIWNNSIAFVRLIKFIKKNKIEIIHCNTPIGGFLGRVCGKLMKVNTIIYTAHGFHFYKGAPRIYMLFKKIEKKLAHFTDAIITMNQEDFIAANEFSLKKKGNVYFVHGVGVNTKEYDLKFSAEEKEKYRNELGLQKNDLILITIGDLIKRKNAISVIEALSEMKSNHIKLLICGSGPLRKELDSKISDMNLEEKIKILGYRRDIVQLLNISDIFILASYQEGLPRSTMEAMSSGLPCVVSKIRGNVELIDEKGGYCIENNNVKSYAKALCNLAGDIDLRKKMGEYNQKKVEDYDINVVKKEMINIYRKMNL